jgi:hypothetical protein
MSIQGGNKSVTGVAKSGAEAGVAANSGIVANGGSLCVRCSSNVANSGCGSVVACESRCSCGYVDVAISGFVANGGNGGPPVCEGVSTPECKFVANFVSPFPPVVDVCKVSRLVQDEGIEDIVEYLAGAMESLSLYRTENELQLLTGRIRRCLNPIRSSRSGHFMLTPSNMCMHCGVRNPRAEFCVALVDGKDRSLGFKDGVLQTKADFDIQREIARRQQIFADYEAEVNALAQSMTTIIIPQSGSASSMGPFPKIRDEHRDPENFSRVASTLNWIRTKASNIASPVIATLQAWLDKISMYKGMAMDYASSKILENQVGKATAKLARKAWANAENIIIGLTVTVLIGLIWKYPKFFSDTLDYIIDFITQGLSVLGDLFSNLGEWVKSCYRHVFSKPELTTTDVVNMESVVVPQAGIPAVVAATMAVSGFLCQKTDSRITPTLEYMKGFFKVLVPLTVGLKLGGEALLGIYDWLPDAIKAVLYNTFGITGSHVGPALSSLITRAMNVIQHYTTHIDGVDVVTNKPVRNVGLDRTLALECITVNNALNFQMAQELKFGKSKFIQPFVANLIHQLKDHVLKAETVLGTGSTRPEPVGLYIFGESGSGKSSVVHTLAAAVFPEAQSDELMFFKNVTDQFNSKYAQQLMYVIDDYGTATGPGSTVPSQDMLRLISCTTANLNMASLNEKGMSFTSKVVVLTTNKTPTATVEGISNAEAFHNRFTHVRAIVKDEYKDKNGKIDVTKDLSDNQHILFELWRMVQKPGSTGFSIEPTKTMFDFTTLAQYVKGGIIGSEERFVMKKLAEDKIREKHSDLTMSMGECLAIFNKYRFGEVESPQLNRSNLDLLATKRGDVGLSSNISMMISNGPVKPKPTFAQTVSTNVEHEAVSERKSCVLQSGGVLDEKTVRSSQPYPSVDPDDDFAMASEMFRRLDTYAVAPAVKIKKWWSSVPQHVSKGCKICKQKGHIALSCTGYLEAPPYKWAVAQIERSQSRDTISVNEMSLFAKLISIAADFDGLPKTSREENDAWYDYTMQWLSRVCYGCRKNYPTRSNYCDTCSVVIPQCGVLTCPMPMAAYCQIHECRAAACNGFMTAGTNYCLKHLRLDSRISALDKLKSACDNYEHLAKMRELAVSTNDKDVLDIVDAKLRLLKPSSLPADLQKVFEQLDIYSMYTNFADELAHTPAQYMLADVERTLEHADTAAVWVKRLSTRTWREYFKDWFSNHGVFKTILKSLTALTVGLVFLKGIIALNSMFRSEQKVEVIPQSWDPDELAKGRFVRSYREDWENRTGRSADSVEEALKGRDYGYHPGQGYDNVAYHPQGGSIDDELAKFRRGMMRVSTPFKFMWALGIGGGRVIMPLHVFLNDSGQIPDGTELRVEMTGHVFTDRFVREKMTCITSKGATVDFCLYNFGNIMPARSDLADKFVYADEILSNCGQVQAMFLSVDSSEECLMTLQIQREDFRFNSLVGQFYLPNHWLYQPKGSGDCGKLLIAKIRGSFRVLGFHIASRSVGGVLTAGMGAVVTREMLDATSEMANSAMVCQSGDLREDGYVKPPCVRDHPIPEDMPVCDLLYMGKLKGAHYMDGRFGWKALPYIAEDWHPKDVFPSVCGSRHPLVPGNLPQKIFKIAAERVHKSSETKALPEHFVRAAIDDVFDNINSMAPVNDVKILEDEEMINGYGAMSGVCMNSSEGYPYNLRRPRLLVYPDGSERPAKGKRWMFSHPDVFGKVSITDEILRTNLKTQEAMLRSGQAPCYIWTAILKDELRTKEKVFAVNTRMVIGSPIDLTLLCRKYFGSLLDHVYGNPLKFGIAVGVNVYSSQWGEMIDKLKTISSWGFDGDFKFFERYFNAQFADRVLYNINKWYKKWDRDHVLADDVARTTIFYIMMHAYVTTGDDCYLSWCLMLSGCYLTTLVNSIMSNAIVRMAYLMIATEASPKHASMDHFRRLVSVQSFGDDIIVAVSKIVEWFNVFSMSTKLLEYNIYFTSGNKTKPTAENSALTNILDCEFLKQTTRVDRNSIQGVIYYPRALEESLIKTLSYSNSAMSLVEATMINGNDVLGRVWSSGLAEFSLWRERIWDVWRRIGLTEVPLSYEDVKTRWMRGEIRSGVYSLESFNFGYAYIPQTAVKDATWLWQSGEIEQPTVVPTEPANVVSIGDPSSNTSVAGYDLTIRSVGTIIKRNFPFMNIATLTTFSFPMGAPLTGSILETSPQNLSCGMLRYFSQLYRVYVGNLRFHSIYSEDVFSSVTNSTDFVSITRPLDISVGNQSGAFAFGSRTLDIQAPFISRYPVLKMPWFDGEVFRDTSSAGSLTFTAQVVDKPIMGTLYVGAADGFRMAALCRIPSLKIVGSHYPHFGGSTVDVPEYYKFSLGSTGFTILLTQSLLDSWNVEKTLTLPATGVAPCTSITVKSANLSVSVLRSIGVNIRDGQPRNVLPGITILVHVNTTDVLIQTSPNIFIIQLDESKEVPNPGNYFEAIATGTVYNFVDHWGMNMRLASAFTVTNQNRANVRWRDLTGMASDALIVANNSTVTTFVPCTPYYTDSGYHLSRWSNGPIALGFGYPAESKHEVIAQSGSMPMMGSVLIHTDGGVQTKSNSITMGEDVPSNIGLVMKEQLVETLTWDVSSGVGTPLSYYEAPFDLVKSLPMRSAFTRYVYWRGNVSLRVQLQSNTFMNGSIIVAWLPLLDAAQSLSIANGNMRSLSVAKHAVLYAGGSSAIELTVPFLHSKSHLDLRVPGSENILGTFAIYVMNPLRVGPTATATTASVSIFASFEESDFAVINPTGVSIIPQGGIQSKVTNINIEHAMNATLDASTTGDNFQGGSTTAPMDLPNVGLNPNPVIERKYPVLCNTANVDFCQVLDNVGSVRPITKPAETGTTVDEMDLRYLTTKLSYHSTFLLQPHNALGEAVFVADLCPAFELFSQPFNSSFTPTLLSYVSFPFSFWKGSLVYKIVAVASPIHTCRLQICSHIGYEAGGLSINEAFGQYTCVFEVQGVSEITLVFPWRSPTEWKKVNTGSNSDTASYSMGQFSIRVLNSLQSMESVAASVDFNVYFGGGADFELTALSNNAIDLVPVDAPM